MVVSHMEESRVQTRDHKENTEKAQNNVPSSSLEKKNDGANMYASIWVAKPKMRNESERCQGRKACSIDPLYIDTDGVGAHMMGPERW